MLVIAVGKLKERYWHDAAAEYDKRLRPYGFHGVVEVADERLVVDEAQARRNEADRLRKATPNQAVRIALTERGELVDSPGLAKKLGEIALAGQGQPVFWIGGA